MKRLLFAVAFILGLSASSHGQSVVINEFRNGGVGGADVVELVVISTNLDMRGMILKDFSGNGAGDGGGAYTFTADGLWSNVRAGTIIVLTNDNSAVDVTAGEADYNLLVGLKHTTYFSTSAVGTFDIATDDILMIKAADSLTNGVTGSIHAFATDTAGAGTNFAAIAVPKLRTLTPGDSPGGNSVAASNSTATLADFNGTDAAGDLATGTIGTWNNANNQTYILSLRGAAATNQPPVVSGADSRNATNAVQLIFSVTALDTLDNDVIELSASNLPAGAVFNTVTNAGGVTNVFNWNPAGPVGVYTTEFHAVDNDGATVVTTLISIINAPSSITNDPIVWINELHYDDVGADNDEGIEIAGLAGTDLSTYYVLVYDGSGVIDISNALSGTIDNEGCGYGAAGIFPLLFIENGIDGVALCQDTNVIQFISYEGSFTATEGPATGIISVDIGVEENQDDPNGLSLQLLGSGTNYNQFAWIASNTASMGALNVGQTISPCGGVNSPPIIQSIGNKVATNNQARVFDVVALDLADGDLIELSASNLPAGAAFNTATNAGGVTNTFTWALAGPPAAVYTVDFYAQDDDGQTTQSITITVLDPPAIAITNPPGNASAPYATTSTVIEGTSSTNVIGEMTWTNALTGGAGTIPASTSWVISGISLNLGGNLITVRGSNVFSEIGSASVTITREQPQISGCSSQIFFQGFEPGDTWAITSGAGFISATTGATDFPPDQRIASGANSWQARGQSATVDLEQVTITGFTGRYIRARVSATATTAAQGLDGGDFVRVFVSLDGGPLDLATDQRGNTNALWGFWATNVLTGIAGESVVPVIAPQPGQSTNNYSYVNVIIPDSANTLAVRIEVDSDNAAEGWSVDDIGVVGCPATCTDCDADGLDDAWELLYFPELTNATATSDADNDGFIDLHEFYAGSLPNDGASLLEETATAVVAAQGFRVTWQSHTGRFYIVARSTNLLNDFIGIATNIAATPPVNVYTDTTAEAVQHYRIEGKNGAF